MGIALGAGVARGWSHIGILRGLEELGIRPDIVVGTSIGAVVGGFWAAGKLEDLEAWARSLDRRRIRKLLDLGLSDGGVIAGERIAAELRMGLGDQCIEELPVRFAAIATDLFGGHEVWMTSGKLSDAMMASFALPGAFAPRRSTDGRWLADGALCNPVPVSVCRGLGARRVIAVNLSATRDVTGEGLDDQTHALAIGYDLPFPLSRLARSAFGNEQSPGVLRCMSAGLSILLDRVARSRLASDPPDVWLDPAVSHLPLLDFQRADDLIREGYAEVMKRKEALLKLWRSLDGT
jgi:NTE family protein